MKNILNYNQFLLENSKEMVEVFGDMDILESIITDSDALLKSINAEEINLFRTFQLDTNSFKQEINIETLYEDEVFNRQLKLLKYKKNRLEETEESETFMDKTIDIKFFSVYKEEHSELEKPEYIIYQYKKIGDSNWQSLKCYKVNEDMKNFYDKLSSKTIELSKNDKKYIFNTSNGGVNWNLQNVNDEDKTFKREMENKDIRALLIDEEISITIIA